MKDFIISIYEGMLFFLLIAAVILGFMTGYYFVPYNPSGLRGLLGATVGLLIAVPTVGHLLTVVAIKETLEWQTRKIGHLENALLKAQEGKS